MGAKFSVKFCSSDVSIISFIKQSGCHIYKDKTILRENNWLLLYGIEKLKFEDKQGDGSRLLKKWSSEKN